MKISSLTPAIPPDFRKVEEKSDAEADSFKETLDREREKGSQQGERHFERPSDEAVRQAIDEFGKETRDKGIRAELQGAGPGLKVLLKDEQGGTLRQMSGSEFMELRSALDSIKGSGKILDQKL